MATSKKQNGKKDRRGSPPGQFAYGSPIRCRSVPEEFRWRMFDALVRLFQRHGRPITREELAAELHLPPSEIHPFSLVNARYAHCRQVGPIQGFIPADLSATRFHAALAALEKAEVGRHDYRIREGQRSVTRTLTINASFKSRIRKLANRVKDHLGIRSWRKVTSERIPQILAAVYEVEMGRSLVPRAQWQDQVPAAKRARKNALNRQSDMRRFLEWAQDNGHIDLRFLALYNRSREPMLSRAWANFIADIPFTPAYNWPLLFARRATGFGAYSPEGLAEMGLDQFTEWMFLHPRYSGRATVVSTLSRFRKVWNTGRKHHPDLPEWASPTRYMQERLEDGGLVRTWWSAGLFMDGKPSILNETGMEEQLRQARDLRDWWTLSNPTTRPDSAGGPLPARPKVARVGGRKIGARTEEAKTASKPLWTVTRFQRFAMTDDPAEGDRLTIEQMKSFPWDELFFEPGRIERFIRYEMQRSAEEHEGRLVKTAGTEAALYVSLLATVYFPAFVAHEMKDLEEEEMDLPEDDAGFRRQRELGQKRKRLLRKQRKWEISADLALTLFREEEARLGGFRPRKNKAEIAERLSHRDLGRIADVFRLRRLDTEGEMRNRTKALVTERKRLREQPCEIDVGGSPCNVVGCNAHHPMPELYQGIARELVDRTYAYLVMKELWMRLPALLPWRPSEFARMRIGQDLDPDTLEVNALRYKNPRTGATISRREAHLPSVQPISGMDPKANEKLIEALNVCLELAQPFLAANPTERGRKAKAKFPHNDDHLFLTWDGVSVRDSKGLATMIARALEDGAQSVNASLQEGEAPIRLPSGWGSRGLQVYRFLWGHRSVESGASMSSVALALGNTERTTREYYQKVRSDSAVNAVAETTRLSERRADGIPDASEPNGTRDGYLEELEQLCMRFEKGLLDRSEFDRAKAILRNRYG